MQFSRQYLLLIANEEWPADLQAKAGASDLVQETQFEAAAALPGFRGHTAGELLGWLRQILLHNLQDFQRKFATEQRRVSREIPLDGRVGEELGGNEIAADVSSPSADFRYREQDIELERALAELPDDYQKVIQWHHRENRSFEDISERLGRSVGAARKLWARAIQQLQERLCTSDEST